MIVVLVFAGIATECVLSLVKCRQAYNPFVAAVSSRICKSVKKTVHKLQELPESCYWPSVREKTNKTNIRLTSMAAVRPLASLYDE